MIKFFKRLWRHLALPTPEQLLNEQLAEAKRELVQAERDLESAHFTVAYYNAQIIRCQATIQRIEGGK